MEDLKKILDYIPKALPVAYVLGFIIINGYLSNYGFSDFNIFNATYLKAGVLLAVIFALVFISVYSAHTDDVTKTNNLEKAWPAIVIAIYNLCLLTVLLLGLFINILELINKNEITIWISNIYIIVFVHSTQLKLRRG